METIESVREKKDSTFQLWKERVNRAGSGSLKVFGGIWEGGYRMQQSPDEFAALCTFLMDYAPFHHFGEIGSASGGTLRFLYEGLGAAHISSIDNYNHVHNEHLDQALNYLGIRGLKTFRGDSHSKEAELFLKERCNQVGKLDAIFIDGDHTHEGVILDIELSLKFIKPTGLLIFHDSVAVEEVRTALEKYEKQLDTLARFSEVERKIGISVCVDRGNAFLTRGHYYPAIP